MTDGAIVVRPARPDDLDGLVALARAAGPGMTNLQPDADALARRIEGSVAALGSGEGGLTSTVVFVLDLGGAMVGTAAIYPNIGAHWPFYSYKRGRLSSYSQALNKQVVNEVLNPVNDLVGYAEAGGLLVSPTVRGRAIGRLAARARYMFIAQHRAQFPQRIMAELRGYQTSQGVSPVWDAIGTHFYGMSFDEADRLSGSAGNQFIAELGPKLSIYVDMLPQAARAALGRPHVDSQRAYDLLIEEGFEDFGYIDIFDGGPQVVANIDNLACVRLSRTARVAELVDEPSETAGQLVSAGTGLGFRTASGHAAAVGEEVILSQVLADALSVKPGDIVRHAKF